MQPLAMQGRNALAAEYRSSRRIPAARAYQQYPSSSPVAETFRSRWRTAGVTGAPPARVEGLAYGVGGQAGCGWPSSGAAAAGGTEAVRSLRYGRIPVAPPSSS